MSASLGTASPGPAVPWSPLPLLEPGDVVDFLWQLQRAASERERFDLDNVKGETRRAVRLRTGSSRHQMVGLPAPLALCGPQQFVQLAKAFPGERDMLILSVPGFALNERLPDSFELAIAHEAQMLEAAVDETRGAPVLFGYSTGGALAYALAAHLERSGSPVAAVVMLDSYLPALTDQIKALVLSLINNPEWRPLFNDTRLTAMGWYTQALSGWDAAAIEAPTLLVRAEVPMPGVAPEGDWKPSWPFPHDVVDVPGDHFSMIQEHAPSAAVAIDQWLRSTLGADD